ncbi:hypothetical protein [Aminobacter sp. MSH1]|uniref:hypothetical protein n=1 Tax=Aminobacter sp. MSH1 TaxID=374606 RepID=UPI000D33886C|nr:hypothetical protein [Aminobacter sp. MSH1]
MTITQTRSIRGRYVGDGGQLSNVQLLFVSQMVMRNGTKVWCDTEGGFELWAEQYAVCEGTRAWQIVGDCAWTFLPEDESVISRIGFSVHQ